MISKSSGSNPAIGGRTPPNGPSRSGTQTARPGAFDTRWHSSPAHGFSAATQRPVATLQRCAAPSHGSTAHCASDVHTGIMQRGSPPCATHCTPGMPAHGARAPVGSQRLVDPLQARGPAQMSVLHWASVVQLPGGSCTHAPRTQSGSPRGHCPLVVQLSTFRQ